MVALAYGGARSFWRGFLAAFLGSIIAITWHVYQEGGWEGVLIFWGPADYYTWVKSKWQAEGEGVGSTLAQVRSPEQLNGYILERWFFERFQEFTGKEHLRFNAIRLIWRAANKPHPVMASVAMQPDVRCETNPEEGWVLCRTPVAWMEEDLPLVLVFLAEKPFFYKAWLPDHVGVCLAHQDKGQYFYMERRGGEGIYTASFCTQRNG